MPTELTGGLSTDMVYAIYGSTSEFGSGEGTQMLTAKTIKPKYEGRAVYELLRGVGTRIYAVSTDVSILSGDQVYSSLAALPGPVDVLIDCLSKDNALKVVEEASQAGIRRVFFQPGTDSAEALAYCETNGIETTKGCMLRHRTVRGLTRFVSPCFYMGMGASKLPVG